MKETAGQVMPIIAVNSVDESREFYVDRLGFGHLMAVVGSDGLLDFCTVVKGGGRIMFTRSPEPIVSPPNAQFYFQVADVEAYYQELLAEGFAPEAPEDMWWGDRVFIVTDNNGCRLWFYQSMRDPEPPAGMKIV